MTAVAPRCAETGGDRLKNVKIVCTIGPASRDRGTLERLIEAGMDVARINFSHGEHEEHSEVYERIRGLSDRVAIMQDLQGPKIRVGDIDGGEMALTDGGEITLTPDEADGSGGVVNVSYPELPDDVVAGDSIYLADGIIHLEVEKVTGDRVQCRILHGGVLTSRKGVNLPGVKISAPALTKKDREDLEFGVELGVDYVALSFVRNMQEVMELKRMISKWDSQALVVAKIEKREAIETLNEIIGASDALMIARGDLGVEIPAEEVPVIQKSIIAECLRKGKPVITATQMLESMVTTERPTRAEASDVANAVLDGTDAVMLSAETATGRYPVETVNMMSRIICEAERYVEDGYCERERESIVSQGSGDWSRLVGEEEGFALTDTVCSGAVKVAEEIGASAIACLTHSGRTARMIARYRPNVPVLALTDFLPVVRHMALVWGVRTIPVECIDSTERIFAIVREQVKRAGYGGRVVLTAGIPTMERRPTNTVHVIDI